MGFFHHCVWILVGYFKIQVHRHVNFHILFIQKNDLLSVCSQHVFLSVSPFSQRSLRRFSAVISPPMTSSSSPAPETRKPQSTKSFTELWLAKKKQKTKKQLIIRGRGRGSLLHQWLYRASVAWKTRDTQLLLCCFVYVCERIEREWREARGHKVTSLEKKQTVLNALRTLVRLELRKCGFLQRTFVFVPFFPLFLTK